MGVLGRWVWEQGPLLLSGEAAKKAEQCLWLRAAIHQLRKRSGFVSLCFAFHPKRAGTDDSGNLAAIYGQLSVTESENPPGCGRCKSEFLATPTIFSFSRRLSQILPLSPDYLLYPF